MFWQYNIYLFILFISIAISAVLLVRLWQLRYHSGSLGLLLAVASVSFWSLFYVVEIVAPDIETKFLAAKIQFIGIPLVPLSLFIFGLQYSGRGRWLTMSRMVALAIIPLLTIIAAFANDDLALIWTEMNFTNNQNYGPLALEHGWGFWVSTAYDYILLVITSGYMVQLVRNNHYMYRGQAAAMLVGIFTPWVVNILYISGFTPFPNLDLTPVAFTITNLAFVIGLRWFNLLEVIPVAPASVVNAMQDAVIVLDREERVVEINQSAQHAFQQDSSVIGKPVTAILPKYGEWIGTAAPDAKVEREITHWEGSEPLYYMMRTAPALDQRNKLAGRIIIFTDITRQKIASRQILLQVTAMEAASNGIVITNSNGIVEWVNPAVSRLTGYSKEEFIGQNPRVLKSGKMPDEVYNELWATIKSGQVWNGEMVNRRKDGSFYVEEMSITPVTQSNGEISHFIAIKQDISLRKLAEEEMKAAHQQAVEANRMKTQLLANVSHDLRTPLGAIIGYVEMLRAGYFGKPSDKQVEVLSEILDSSNQLLAFINNLIGQAQLETGKVILKNRKFDPCELVRNVQDSAALLANKKGLALRTSVDPTLPKTLVGDPYWLQQILQNLVNNAIKFTEHGSVGIHLFSADKDHWAVQVTDTGEGIPQDAQAVIFEAFRQVDGTVTRKAGGSGLGLNIVKELTGLMSGSIHLQSTIGQGSTFTITLPFITTNTEKEK